MIDKLEKMDAQELALAKALGMDISEVEGLSLHQMRLEFQRKAFKMRDNTETITQKEANQLNNQYQEIIRELEEFHDYDQMCDYIVDFDSFVVENEQYNRFCW